MLHTLLIGVLARPLLRPLPLLGRLLGWRWLLALLLGLGPLELLGRRKRTLRGPKVRILRRVLWVALRSSGWERRRLRSLLLLPCLVALRHRWVTWHTPHRVWSGWTALLWEAFVLWYSRGRSCKVLIVGRRSWAKTVRCWVIRSSGWR